MQDRPTASELLEALSAFMRDRAENARDRWERFQFQVASNSLAIIRREIEIGGELMREEWRGLDALLGEETMPAESAALSSQLLARNDELSDRIRSGEFDGEAEDALLAHLWTTVVNKVRIASPNEIS